MIMALHFPIRMLYDLLVDILHLKRSTARPKQSDKSLIKFLLFVWSCGTTECLVYVVAQLLKIYYYRTGNYRLNIYNSLLQNIHEKLSL